MKTPKILCFQYQFQLILDISWSYQTLVRFRSCPFFIQIFLCRLYVFYYCERGQDISLPQGPERKPLVTELRSAGFKVKKWNKIALFSFFLIHSMVGWRVDGEQNWDAVWSKEISHPHYQKKNNLIDKFLLLCCLFKAKEGIGLLICGLTWNYIRRHWKDGNI